MMNFQYIKDLDNEHLNASFELKEIVLSLNEDNVVNQVVVKRKHRRLKNVMRG